MVGCALVLDYWDQPTLRMRRVYTVLIVWPLATAETGGAKGREGSSLLQVSRQAKQQVRPMYGSQVMLLQKYGFQNQEMVTIPWILMGDPSFSFWEPEGKILVLSRC